MEVIFSLFFSMEPSLGEEKSEFLKKLEKVLRIVFVFCFLEEGDFHHLASELDMEVFKR